MIGVVVNLNRNEMCENWLAGFYHPIIQLHRIEEVVFVYSWHGRHSKNVRKSDKL